MGVTVKIEEIKELMRKALALRGITGEYAEFMISDYLESELEGHRTHGLVKIPDGGCRPFQEKRRDEAVKTEGLLCPGRW